VSRGSHGQRRELPRRRVLGAGLGVAGLGILAGGGYEVWQRLVRNAAAIPRRRRSARVAPATTATSSHPIEIDEPTLGPVTADWIAAENLKPGTADWAIEGAARLGELDGYCDHISAQQGDTVRLFVSCQAPSFTVSAYRMGWYQGLGARLIWSSGQLAGTIQPEPTFTPSINMIECSWTPSLSVAIDSTWPPGDYLFKLTASNGQQRYVPLTIRDDQSSATYVIQNSVTTWQAYNWWGGYCLYYGPNRVGAPYMGEHGLAGKDFNSRSRVVSFDRPYPHDWAYGAADFIGNEYPLVMLVERMGLDVTYWTDVDFHARPDLLTNHRCLISLGHDEYWSIPMFDGAMAGLAKGVNFMFLGANACYRRIRFTSSPLGANRREICYKVASEDPEYGIDNSEVTANWPDYPDPRPESELIGNMYQSNGVDGSMVIVDPTSWILSGTNLAEGDRLAHLIGPEYDGYDPAVPSPTNLDVIAHSPVVGIGGNPGFADMTWYTKAGGGGVFSTGTNWWIYKLSDNQGQFNVGLVPTKTAGVTDPLTTITKTVLSVTGVGPASKTHPSTGNWQNYYPGPGTRANYRTSWPP
jgi:hypothetical protein